MKLKHLLIGAMATFVLSTSAQAATVTIDFTGYTNGGQIGNTYASLGAVFTGAQFLQCGGGCPQPDPNGWFAYANNGTSFSVMFSLLQNFVTFQTVSNSSTLATAYDISNNVVAFAAENQGFPVSEAVISLAGAGIKTVVFSYNGGSNGPAPTNLTFNAGVGAIPEPTAWALMIGGFGMAGAMIRRRRALAA